VQEYLQLYFYLNVPNLHDVISAIYHNVSYNLNLNICRLWVEILW